MESVVDSQTPKKLANTILRFGVSNPENGYTPYASIVGVGKRLNEFGGYDAMLVVAKLVQEKDRVLARELEFAWNGIGKWQA